MVPSDPVVVELENGKSDTTNPLKRCYFAFTNSKFFYYNNVLDPNSSKHYMCISQRYQNAKFIFRNSLMCCRKLDFFGINLLKNFFHVTLLWKQGHFLIRSICILVQIKASVRVFRGRGGQFM